MKKRNVIYGLLALFCTFVLAGCQGLPGLPGQGGLDIGDIAIEGVEDVKIDTNLNQIRFEVKSTVDSFDVKSIKAPENVTGVYCVDGNGNKLQDMLALSEGENRFTLVFEAGEAKATWTLTIKRLTKEEENKKVASIEVTDYVKDYFVGDKFKGGAIKVTYLDGTVKNLPITLDLLAGFDTKTPGEHEVTVAYKGAVTAITITVKERVVLSSIELKEAETSYFINDGFKGATITLKYSDNTTKDVIATEEMLSGFDTATSGSKVVTITYEGKSCEFTINVIEVRDIKLDNAKLSYLVGDEFESFEAVVEYSDGKKENITVTKDMVAGFDTKVVGIKRVKLSYLNKEVSYDITVRELTEITLKSAEVNYELGDDLKATVITLHYTDGKNITTKDVNVTKEMLSGFDTTVAGSKVVTITYEGKTCEYTINVKDPVVITGIEMKSFEGEYLHHDLFKGAVINILFSNDTKKEYTLTAKMLEGFNTEELGKHTVTVKYGEFTTTFEINVSKKIDEIIADDFVLIYYLKDEFKPTNLEVFYSDGTKKTVKLDTTMLEGFSTAKAGEVVVTINYEGLKLEKTILVQAKNERLLACKDVLASLEAITEIEYGSNVDRMFKQLYEIALNRTGNYDIDRFSNYLDSLNVTTEQLKTFTGMIKSECLNILKMFYRADINQGNSALFEILSQLTIEDIQYIQASLIKVVDIFTSKQISKLLLDLDIETLINEEINGNYHTEDYQYYNETLKQFIHADLADIIKIFGDEPLKNYLSFSSTAVKLVESEFIELIDAGKSLIKTIAGLKSADIKTLIDAVVKFDYTLANSADGIHALGRIVSDVVANKYAVDTIGKFIETRVFSGFTEGVRNIFVRPYAAEAVEFVIKNIEFIAEYLETVDVKVLKAIDTVIAWMSEDTEAEALNSDLLVLAVELNSILDTISPNGVNDSHIAFWLTTTGCYYSITLRQLNIIRECAKFTGTLTEEQITKLRNMIPGFTDYPETNLNSQSSIEVVLAPNPTYDDLLKELDLYKNSILLANEKVDFDLSKVENQIIEALKTPGIYRFTFDAFNTNGREELELYILVLDEKDTVRGIYAQYDKYLPFAYVDANDKVLGFKKNSYNELTNDIKDILDSSFKFYVEEYDACFYGKIKDHYIDYRIEKLPATKVGLAQLIVNTDYCELRYIIQYVKVDMENPEIQVLSEKDQFNENKIIYGRKSLNINIDYGYKIINIEAKELGINPLKLGVQEATLTLEGKTYKFNVEVISDEEANNSFTLTEVNYINLENLNESFKSPSNNYRVESMYGSYYLEYEEYINRLNRLYHNKYKSFDFEVEHIDTINERGVFKLTIMGDGKAIGENYFMANILNLEDYNLVYFDSRQIMRLELTDADFANIKNLTAEELDAFMKDYLARCEWSIYSAKYGNFNNSRNNLFDVLKELNITYVIDKELTDDSFTCTLTLLDNRKVSFEIYKESYNRTNLEWIGLNKERYEAAYLSIELDTPEKLLNVLLSDYNLVLGYIAEVRLNSNAIKEFLANREYTITLINENGRYLISLAVDGFTAKEQINVIDIENSKIYAEHDYNYKYGTKNFTVDILNDMLSNRNNSLMIYVECEYNRADISRKIKFISVDSITDVEPGFVNILATYEIGGKTYQITLEHFGYYEESEYTDIRINNIDYVFTDDVKNPTVDEALKSAEFVINGRFLSYPDLTIIKKMFTFTIIPNSNDEFRLNYVNNETQREHAEFFKTLPYSYYDKVKSISMMTKNNMYVDPYGTINIAPKRGNETDLEALINALVFIEVTTYGNNSSIYSEKDNNLNEFISNNKLALAVDENGFYQVTVNDTIIVDEKFLIKNSDSIIDEYSQTLKPNVVESNERLVVVVDSFDNLDYNAIFKSVVDSVEYTSIDGNKFSYTNAELDKFINNNIIFQYHEYNHTLTARIIGRYTREVRFVLTDNPNSVISAEIIYVGSGKLYNSVTEADILNEIASLYVLYANGEAKHITAKDEIKKSLGKYDISCFDDQFVIRFVDFDDELRLSRNPNSLNNHASFYGYIAKALTLEDLMLAIKQGDIDISFYDENGHHIYMNNNKEVIKTIKLIESKIDYFCFSLTYEGLEYKLEFKPYGDINDQNIMIQAPKGVFSANPTAPTLDEILSQMKFQSDYITIYGYTKESFLANYTAELVENGNDYNGKKYIISYTNKITGVTNNTNSFYIVSEEDKDKAINFYIETYSVNEYDGIENYMMLYTPTLKPTYTLDDILKGLKAINIEMISGNYYLEGEEILDFAKEHPGLFTMQKDPSNDIYKLITSTLDHNTTHQFKFTNVNEIGKIEIDNNGMVKGATEITKAAIYNNINSLDVYFLDGTHLTIKDKAEFANYLNPYLRDVYDNRAVISFEHSNYNMDFSIGVDMEINVTASAKNPIIMPNEDYERIAKELLQRNKLNIYLKIAGDLEALDISNYQLEFVGVSYDGANLNITINYSGAQYAFAVPATKAVK